MVVLAGLAFTQCVLPNEPLDEGPAINQAPVIDFESVDPAEPVTRVGIACGGFQVQANAIDPDSEGMLFRWVVRDEDDTRFKDDSVTDDAPNTLRNAQTRFFLNPDFMDQLEVIDETGEAAIGNRTAMVTLYATDAPSWAIVNPSEEGQGQKTGPGDDKFRDYPADFNLGRIPSFEETGERNSVTSYSWVFEFTPQETPCLN